MADIIRDAPLGQVIRWVTRKKYLQFPEERAGFDYPYCDPAACQPVSENARPTVQHRSASSTSADTVGLEKAETVRSTASRPTRPGLERHATTTRTSLARALTLQDLEIQFTQASLAKPPTQPIVPEKTADGTILVDWYTTDDPENPQNWSFGKKLFVACQIYLYTLAVYMGSAIYAPSTEGVMREFGVSQIAASLGLALYVLAYGTGPLIFSPLSEIPSIGRNPPYMITFAIFVIVSVPCALVDNFAGLLVLRFLQGFFGSPCLATGGASLQDMYSLIKLPYVLSLWALSATCGPALGPIISGFSVTAMGWRWSLWEILWLSAPIWLLLFTSLPETSPQNILLRRAKRLRALTGNSRLQAQSEIDQANMSVNAVVVEALWRPIQLILLDPAIAFTAAYTALIYGIFYSFFEAFPIVYISGYGFTLGEMGLTFLSITVGVIVALAAYWSYIYWIVEPEIKTEGLGAPERKLIPALFVSFLLPIGLFIFAWTSRPDIHWIVNTIGVAIFTIGVFLIIQCIFLYLPLSYPQYAASLFAGNDLARSVVAFAAILFSYPLFHNLGVDVGVSLLAAFTVVCIAGVFVLYFFGDRLRARSRFAAKQA